MKLNRKVRLLITCDSGAAAGKTTAAKYLSNKFGLHLLTSGLLYRYVALKLLESKKKTTNIIFLKKITKNINSKLLKNKKLYTPEITEYTSKIAKVRKVRFLLRNYQKKFSKKRLAVMEGRDQGILFPNADIKFFFICSLNVAAKRRLIEYRKKNKKISFNEVKKAIKLRDSNDSKRKLSPLKPAKDAVIVNTSKVDKKQMLTKLSKIVEKKIKEKYGSLQKSKFTKKQRIC